MGGVRARGAAALLILLALASFAAAAIYITNITEWNVRARSPPIKKRPGSDIISSWKIYTSVYYRYAGDGTNRTVIILTGFTGDHTEYEEALKICNIDTIPYAVRLVYDGLMEGYYWTHVQYVEIWLKDKTNKITLQSGTDSGVSTGWVTLSARGQPGDCAGVGVRMLVKPTAPYEQTVIGFIVNVESKTPP